MPNIKAAMKSLRNSKKLQIKNTAVKSNIDRLLKKSRKAVETKSADAKNLIHDAVKAIDKAVQKKILKPNAGNRKKSRLMKKFNQIIAK
ncbi:30S ribosomal protein S20 [Candidatus Falkowbacteria bacterium CG10_big_fil_rev_8_21_14_0_10_43_11]|uniref:Small ribosomal subunit protein bS20 n=1 Tax=Candidatus Falkowbacteria bacterium CG10_big_fil_rev_8_21_14_0_10_43_11 TaxID=1974568 RepID=A0A2M6WLL1_9BACT|nr:MAG: 30S ribosomal protein S20 [Candidatus Falkowbacteria bacterium CG10_big_fil_rev_8_21_14_0_10_43_11]